MASKPTVMSVDEEPCPVDILVLVCVGTLLAMGVLLVASASSEISTRDYGSALYLVTRHIIFIGLAIGMGIITLMVPLEVWRRSGWLMVVVSYLVLAAVLVPGIGKEVNGSTRWIPLGFFTLQGSEFVKLMMVMFIASYMTNPENRDHALGFLKAMAAIVGVVALLLLQPDLGSAVVIFVAFFGVIFLSGTPFRFLLPVIVAAFASLVVLIMLAPYRFERILAFFDPWAHQYESGYQLTQALIAFGRGDWFGMGIGNSIQKLFFLPEAHTDFVYSILVEEFGLLSAIFVLAILMVLILRALWIAYIGLQRSMTFHSLVAGGIALLIGIQTLINIGVNVGALPTKGLTLPLLSFGGNSLLATIMMIAVLLRAEYELRHATSAPIVVAKRRRGTLSAS